MGVFGIGISGMNAAQAGLVTTGHNISNASTPGYSRQEVVQTSNIPQSNGTGFLGQGVSVVTERRLYNDALSGQLTLAQTQGSQFDAYNVQIKQLSNMFSDPSAGLAPVLSNFFGGVGDVAAHPESVPSRQALLSAANSLTTRFRDFDRQMSQMNTSINADITASVNTGDDTVLPGLSISPDLDTVTYTLASAIDPVRGWGLENESWTAYVREKGLVATSTQGGPPTYPACLTR